MTDVGPDAQAGPLARSYCVPETHQLTRALHLVGALATIRLMARYVLRVNGRDREVDAEPGDSLLSILRYDFGLTGSRYGCGEGQCGACTVLLDGAGARSCVTRVGSVGSKAITTIEALADGDRPPSGAAGVSRGRSVPVRLLHVGNDHGDRRPAPHQPEPVRAGRRPADGWQRLPLRHLPADRAGGPLGRRARCETRPQPPERGHERA